MRVREEVLNVCLAQLLAQRGVVAMPESIATVTGRTRRLPDVLVRFRGLRTAIEGKLADTQGAEAIVIAQAAERVEEGIAHLAIAVIYPKELRSADTLESLTDALAQAELRVAVLSEADGGAWTTGTIDALAEMLRRTFSELVREDVVTLAVETLNAGVDEFATALQSATGTVARCAVVLGIRDVEPVKA